MKRFAFPSFLVSRPWITPLALALLGTFLIYRSVATYKTRLGYSMKTVKVLVAAREVQEGEHLSEKEMAVAELPEKFLPIGAARPGDSKRMSGRVVLRPLAKGEIVLWSVLDVSFGSQGPARRIARGYRAVSIDVDASTSVAQAVLPGDRVDLVVTGSYSEKETNATLTLLQNVAVLDVGSRGDDDGNRYSVVSLMVLPKEVGLIVHAGRAGKITLSLRNPDDRQTRGDLPIVSSADLLESAFRNALQNERNGAVEIIRGGKVSIDQ